MINLFVSLISATVALLIFELMDETVKLISGLEILESQLSWPTAFLMAVRSVSVTSSWGGFKATWVNWDWVEGLSICMLINCDGHVSILGNVNANIVEGCLIFGSNLKNFFEVGDELLERVLAGPCDVVHK